MARTAFPDRHAQYELYRRILEGFAGQPVTIRTLDIGGDKGLPYFQHPKEDNPFMGWRSIRISLERQDIFRDQLAGILMASVHGEASIMLPMVASLEEIRATRLIIEDVKSELARVGREFRDDIQVGIMIELPAAVQTADILIKEADFFSIGTNDLIQYTLAADRNNPKVKQYYDPHHPAVLRAIKRVADVAHGVGKRVSICGEMAADPLNALLLVGMGITELSLAAPAIPPVKALLRRTTGKRGQEIAKSVLSLGSSSEITGYLAAVRRELELD
jgi:phosphotransferase system enzyme I (PtsP)